MTATLLLMAAVAAQATPVPAPAPAEDAVSMTVSPAQLTAALASCATQIAKPAPAPEDLASASWVKVASTPPSASGPTVIAYRHPTNMMMIALVDQKTQPDQCAVMVPFGPSLDSVGVIRQVTAATGVRPRGNLWQAANATVASEPMGQAGMRILYTKKES